MIEQLPKTDPREQKLIDLMSAKVGDKVLTDNNAYKITNIEDGLFTLKVMGRKKDTKEDFLIRTADDLANQMLDEKSWVIKKSEETVEEETEKGSGFNILEVRGGDILEMSDGSYLKILENDPTNKEVTFEQISPDMDTSKKGEVKSRGYDIFSVYQDEIKDYLPNNQNQESISKPKKSNGNNGKGVLNNEVPQDLINKKRDKSTRWGDTEEEKARVGKKNNADKILDNLDTTPPEEATISEPVVEEKPKRGRPKKVETPPAIKQSLEEAGKIMAELETTNKPNKQEIPLNLKEGQVIWDERGNEVIVLDVVTNPINEDEDLMDGYVTLLYPPQKGRNKGSVEVKVSFSDLEKGKNKIFFTEQIPFIEIDKEAEKETVPELMVLVARDDHNGKDEGFIYKSVSLKELNEWNNREGAIAPGEKVGVKRTKTKKIEGGWEVVGSWFNSEENKSKELYDDYVEMRKERRIKRREESTAFADLVDEQEPPPLPAEYLAKVEADKKLEENRRLNELREEMMEISHGDLGADLAKHWTPVDVEMPKREPPLSPSLRKLPKKSWWQRLLGL